MRTWMKLLIRWFGFLSVTNHPLAPLAFGFRLMQSPLLVHFLMTNQDLNLLTFTNLW